MTDPTSLPNFQPPTPSGGSNGVPAGTPVRDRIAAELTKLGIESTVDNDGDLEYVVNEQTLFARVAEGELPLVRFFGQWQLQEPVSPDRNERLARCNDMTLQLNLVKLSLVQDSLVVSAEQVVTPHADLDILVPLSINHILQSVGFFFQTWQPPEDAAGAAGAAGTPEGGR